MKKVLALVLISVLVLTSISFVAAQDDLYIPIGDQPDRFHWDGLQEFADKYDLEGQELEIFGPWITVDEEHINAVIDYFEWATGAVVSYSGSDDAESLIKVRVEGGDPPDIYVFPQPGAAADEAAQGLLVPLGEETGNWIRENYAGGDAWASFATLPDENGEDQVFIFPYKQDLKSIVWYVPDNFADAGYEVPKTMEELMALADQMIADGTSPWCLGIESGGATGWPATDWIEDIMLRTQPFEVYEGWVNNTVKFTDPAVIEALNIFGDMVLKEGAVANGVESIATTSFRDAPAGLFTTPPQCYMHRQASFISSNFPEGVEVGVDADFFYFPAYESKDLGEPVLTAGTLFGMFNDTEAARAFIEYLKLPLAHEIWMSRSGMLTAHSGVFLDAYADDILRAQGEILLNASTAGFDASDLMPGAIGTGAFWTGMVDFVNGASAEDVAAEIQAVWDGLE